MLPDIQPGNTKILYFFNCLLDGMHTIGGNGFVCSFPSELNRKLCYNGGVLIYLQEECYNEKTI